MNELGISTYLHKESKSATPLNNMLNGLLTSTYLHKGIKIRHPVSTSWQHAGSGRIIIVFVYDTLLLLIIFIVDCTFHEINHPTIGVSPGYSAKDSAEAFLPLLRRIAESMLAAMEAGIPAGNVGFKGKTMGNSWEKYGGFYHSKVLHLIKLMIPTQIDVDLEFDHEPSHVVTFS